MHVVQTANGKIDYNTIVCLFVCKQAINTQLAHGNAQHMHNLP